MKVLRLKVEDVLTNNPECYKVVMTNRTTTDKDLDLREDTYKGISFLEGWGEDDLDTLVEKHIKSIVESLRLKDVVKEHFIKEFEKDKITIVTHVDVTDLEA